MAIATRVEGAGYRVCETGIPTCTGLNPCFGCWVKTNQLVLPGLVRFVTEQVADARGLPVDSQQRHALARQLAPQMFALWQSHYLHLSDTLAGPHAEAFRAMQDAVIDAPPERRVDPEVRAQPYWVVLATQDILAVNRSRAPSVPIVPPAIDVIPGEGKLRRGEVRDFVRESSEGAVASPLQSAPVTPAPVSSAVASASAPDAPATTPITAQGQVLARAAFPRHVIEQQREREQQREEPTVPAQSEQVNGAAREELK